jgi:hypothetical protein
MAVLAFPRDSMTFTVHCQLVDTTVDPGYTGNKVWGKVVGFVP